MNMINANIKNIAIMLSFALMISLAGCLTGCTVKEEKKIVVYVESENDNKTITSIGIDNLIEIGSGLYYDSTTQIVYWWNGGYDLTYHATTPTPYYSYNGNLYRFDPQTNTFNEIIHE